MKKYLNVIAFGLFCVSAQAQFPVQSKSRNVDEIEYHIYREGHLPNVPTGSAVTSNRVKVNAAVSGSNITFTVTPGTILYKPRIILSVDRPMNFLGTLYQTGAGSNLGVAGGNNEPVNVNFPKGGGSVELMLPQALYDGAKLNLNSQYSDTTTTASVLVSIGGVEYTNDECWECEHVIFNFGDSQAGANAMGNDPNGGRYLGYNHYSFVVRDSLRSYGKSVRLVNRHHDSGTSAQYIEELRSGKYDNLLPDLLIVHGPYNDATAAVTQAFTDRMNWFIGWVYREWKASLKKYPTRRRPTIVFVSPPPTDRTPNVTNLPGYRSALAALANPANNIYYFDASTVLTLNATATADVNYAVSERISGLRTHLSGIGSTIEGNALFAYLKTLPFYATW